MDEIPTTPDSEEDPPPQELPRGPTYVLTGPGLGSQTPEACYEILPDGTIHSEPEALDMSRFGERIDDLRGHPGFGRLMEDLPPHTRLVVEKMLESGVTPRLIAFADDCPEDEWKSQDILRMMVGGNIYMLYGVTDLVLSELEYMVDHPDEE
jgi:hypothetical protein